MTERVPTALDLVARGMARIITPPKGSSAGVFHISDEGHRTMGEAMRRNALEQRADS